MIIFRQKEYSAKYKFKKIAAIARGNIRKGKNSAIQISNNPGKVITEMTSDAIGNPVNGTITGVAPGGILIGKVARPITDIVDKPLNKAGFGKLQRLYDRYLKKPVNGAVNGAAQSLKYMGGGI